MKPRSAVATYIVNHLTSALAAESALATHCQSFKQKSRKPLTAKQKARVAEIGAFYLDQIKHLLATVEFEGDTADVPGVDVTAGDTASATGDTASATGEAEIGPDNDPLNWNADDVGATLADALADGVPFGQVVIHIGTVNIGR